MPQLIVHHLNNSRSQRILWLLEELGTPYELKIYQRGADLRAPKELKDVHQLGKSPVITTEEGKVIAESGAIVEYIIRRYGNGRCKPTSEDDTIDDSFWSHFAEGSLMPPLVMKLIFGIVPSQAPFFVRPLVKAVMSGLETGFLHPQLQSLIQFVSQGLEKKAPGGKGWFAGGDSQGEPTMADYMMLFPLEAIVKGNRVPPGTQGMDAIKAYIDAVHSRPAYQRALEKGGPYAYS
ncbi:unnamed protein product [Sympodiomycopsis kandeliae]